MKDGEFLNEDFSCAAGWTEHIWVPRRVLWSSFKVHFIRSFSKRYLSTRVGLGYMEGICLIFQETYEVFQSSCTTSHSHQHCLKVPLA